MKAPKKSTARTVPLDQIQTEAGIQTRVQLDDETIEDYSQAMRSGAEFPGVVLFQTKPTGELILADGFHRVAAARKAGLREILAEVRQGDRRAATTYALRANVQHGRRRTSADKRRSVEIALHEFGEYSDRRLAELCCVTDSLVRSIRTQVQDSRTSSPARRVGKDGKAYPSKPRPQMVRNARLSTQHEETQAQVQVACPPCAGDIPARSDATISRETPGDQQFVQTFRQLIEKAVTARPGSIRFFRAHVAAMGAWLDGLPPVTDRKIPAITETNIHASPEHQFPVAGGLAGVARTAPEPPEP